LIDPGCDDVLVDGEAAGGGRGELRPHLVGCLEDELGRRVVGAVEHGVDSGHELLAAGLFPHLPGAPQPPGFSSFSSRSSPHPTTLWRSLRASSTENGAGSCSSGQARDREHGERGNEDAVERVRAAQRLVGEVALDIRRERVPRAQ
jgi:hypothetical protein